MSLLLEAIRLDSLNNTGVKSTKATQTHTHTHTKHSEKDNNGIG